jgi:predicted phage terminase large subunit-like protein
VSGGKVERAFGLSTRVNRREVAVVEGPWNERFLAELDEFPPDGGHDDQVDAAAHAYNWLHPPGGRPGVRVIR